ncbi:MAG: hypothetical protein NZ455_12235, partial [Bacteroidia bacterium]|nr:hypothetical protein [Bacteroidia bacterium]MDW8345559.1 hypothetical protein [Bacteroidia bacterium]
VGGWGAAPLARSTPTRAQRGTRPKKVKLFFRLVLDLINFITYKKPYFCTCLLHYPKTTFVLIADMR